MPISGVSVHDLRFDTGPAGNRQTIVSIDRLDLEPGQMISFSGPSGSGKSTLLYLLSGLLVPASGTIMWGSTDLAKLGEVARDRWRRENAGFVFQGFHLIEELSPIDNVLAPVWFGHMRAGRWRERARQLLDRFGVPRDRRSAGLMSRGEQQRVALARALIFDPSVIFADEPTASLDVESARKVAQALADLARRENRLVIAASHDEELHRLADRRMHIQRGRFAEGIAA